MIDFWTSVTTIKGISSIMTNSTPIIVITILPIFTGRRIYLIFVIALHFQVWWDIFQWVVNKVVNPKFCQSFRLWKFCLCLFCFFRFFFINDTLTDVLKCFCFWNCNRAKKDKVWYEFNMIQFNLYISILIGILKEPEFQSDKPNRFGILSEYFFFSSHMILLFFVHFYM